MKIELARLECCRCGHIWLPRKDDPMLCPRCKSNKWQVPKEEKVNKTEAPAQEQTEKESVSEDASV